MSLPEKWFITALSRYIDTDLVITALKWQLKKGKSLMQNKQLIHHSDQGVQYCSYDYTNLLEFYGIRISMSNSGPLAKWVAESFFKTLKLMRCRI